MLKKFCCCCTLRTGTLVIGTMGTLSSLAATLTMLIISITKEYYTRIFPSKVVNIISLLICSGVCISLVVGAYMQKRRYMLPWLVLSCVEIIFLGCAVCAGILMMVIFGAHEKGALVIFLLVILTVFAVYSFLCVLGYYQYLGKISNRAVIVPTGDTPEETAFENPKVYYTSVPEEEV